MLEARYTDIEKIEALLSASFWTRKVIISGILLNSI